MRKFFVPSLFALALVIGATGAASVAHAQAANGVACIGAVDCASDYCDFDTKTCQPFPSSIANAVAPVDPAAAAAAAKTTLDAGKGSLDDAYDSIMTKIVSLFAWLVGVAALTLDNAVFYTVVRMGTYVGSLTAIGVTWRILRDIGNIALIFGFLAIGISTILNTERLGWGKKMLPMMLVAAVFLNFSLFFSEAIIDVGNLFATQFYTQINGGQPAGAKSFDPGFSVRLSNEGISNKLMAQLGLQKIYGDALTPNTQVLTKGAPWYIGFMGILLFIITAFVMFSLAFILIARFVMLIFLIILAPIGFAGLAVPQLAGKAKQWWSKLFEQTITAPVLLLMLYVALAVITDAQFLTGLGGGTAGAATGFVNNADLGGFGGYVLSFLVAMGLLLAVTIQAKNLSAFGADAATGLAGKLTFGATAWGMNRTVGRGAYYLGRAARQNKTFNKVNAITGRALSGTLDRVAAGSFDVRGVAMGGGLKGIGVEAGAAQKGGFVEARKQNIKAHEDEAKRIEEAHKEAAPSKEELRVAAMHWETEKAKNTAQQKKDEIQKEFDALKNANARPEDLKKTEENLTKATEKLATATEAETRAKKTREDVEKAASERKNVSLKEAKMAYAEGINHPINNILNPLPLVSYGPGTGEAAQKIKNSLKEKPTKDKFLEMAQKMAKELEDTEKKKEEAPKPEEAH